MAILVTGGAGFIGSHTCVELLNAGYDVVIADNLYNASEKAVDRVKQITGKDLKFYKADIRSKELVKQRMEGIQAVLSGEPVTVVTSLDGFMDHLAPKESIAEKVLKIQNDSVLKLDEMAEKLSVIGYARAGPGAGPAARRRAAPGTWPKQAALPTILG